MNKKLVSLALACSLAAGSMSIGFAAGELTADIDDSKVVKAVERLSAFGIVDGMDDGKYHPELEVTREQFAKVLVEALGLGSAAEAALGGTQFADVEAGRWSAGYINVAVGQGILKGYPDGTFQPAAKVKYSEAVTMLVRALGYQDSFLPGSWPGNYVAKAAEEGVTKGVAFSPSGFADRGSMAVMVDNTLDADVVKISEYGTLTGTEIKYAKSETTLLEEKLEIFKLEEAVVVGTPKVDNGIDEDQIKVEIGEDYVVDDKGIDYEEGKEKTFDVLDTVDNTNLLGLSLNVYINDDKEVVYVEESDSPFKVIYDVIDSAEKVNEDEVTFIKLDKDYEFEMDGNDEDYKIYIDNEEADIDDLAKLVKDNKDQVFVKAVLSDKGNIKVIDAYDWDGPKSGVVKEASESSLVYFVDDADDEDTFKAKDYDKVVVMDSTGKAMTLADIQKNDVIYINDEDQNNDDLEEAASGDEVAYVVVVRDSLSGNVERYNQAKMEVRVDGDNLDVTGEATVSSNDNQDIYEFVSGDGETALDDITGDDEKALVILDAKGYVRHITTDAEASSSDLYAVVTAKDTNFGDVEVKLLNKDEEVVKYEFDADKGDDFFGGYNDESDVKEGDIIKYTLDSDGQIDSAQKVASYDETTGTYTVADVDQDDFEAMQGTLTDDFTDDSMEVGGKDYVVSSNVVVFDYTEGLVTDKTEIDDLEDIEVIDFASLEDKGDKDNVVFFTDDNDEVQLIVLTEQIQSDDERAAYITEKWTKDGDKFIEVVEFDKEGKTDLEVDNKVDYDAETVIVFTENTDGTIDVAALNDDAVTPEKDFTFYTGIVSDISGKYLDINLVDVQDDKYEDGDKIKTVKAESDVVVYQEDDEKDFSDIDEGDLVTVAVKDGKIQVAKIYDWDTDDKIDEDDSQVEAFVKAYEAHNGTEPGTVVDEDVKAVEDAIDDLPAVADLTLDDEEDVVAAREAYDALSSSEKEEVDADAVKALEAAEAKIAELKEGELTAEVTVEVSPALPSFKKLTVNETSVEGAVSFSVNGGAATAIGETVTAVISGTDATVEILDADGEVLAEGTVEVGENGTVTINLEA